jgi:hypothetical protein
MELHNFLTLWSCLKYSSANQIIFQVSMYHLFVFHFGKLLIINTDKIAKFQLLLSEESWDSVHNADDINSMFNFFHCTF